MRREVRRGGTAGVVGWCGGRAGEEPMGEDRFEGRTKKGVELQDRSDQVGGVCIDE